jgi:cysteine desulfuration protein SufE
MVSRSNTRTLEDVLEEFEDLGDWDDQCDYLIDLGYELPELPAEAKTEANRVHGCQSNVWLVARVEPGDPPRIEFTANSDAIIVNGLIAVLTLMYSGKTAEEILRLDAREVFHKLGLERHLSSQRRNGLFGMVERIRQIAVAALAA